MDNQETHSDAFQDGHNFLQDENFIRWRLLPSEELDKYWEDFIAQNPEQKAGLENAIRQFAAVKINSFPLDQQDRLDIDSGIQRRIRHHKRRLTYFKIASAAAILLTVGLSVLFVADREEPASIAYAEEERIVGQMLPEEEIYLISGDNKISIAHQSHIRLDKDGTASINENATSEQNLVLHAEQMNTLVVPYGKRTTMTLSDGTQVWLNSGTQLDFPTEFSGSKREIHVNGEIFIDVAHNARLPFIVHAQDMDIQVHGTSFNVSAYRGDRTKSIVLVDGKVQVETTDKRKFALLPNEKLEMVENRVTQETVSVSQYISWTKGILEFNETPVSEMLGKIGRYYNVQFESGKETKLNDKTFSGKLFLSNNLDSVMASVSTLSSTVYRRDNNTIHLTKK